MIDPGDCISSYAFEESLPVSTIPNHGLRFATHCGNCALG